MTDQLASARGRAKNIRNQLGRLKYTHTHASRYTFARVAKRIEQDEQYMREQINELLDALEALEGSDENSAPPGDYYVLTPNDATLQTAARFTNEASAALAAASHGNAKVVHRPNRP